MLHQIHINDLNAGLTQDCGALVSLPCPGSCKFSDLLTAKIPSFCLQSKCFVGQTRKEKQGSSRVVLVLTSEGEDRPLLLALLACLFTPMVQTDGKKMLFGIGTYTCLKYWQSHFCIKFVPRPSRFDLKARGEALQSQSLHCHRNVCAEASLSAAGSAQIGPRQSQSLGWFLEQGSSRGLCAPDSFDVCFC